jgi:hypothetical protein
MSAVNLSDNETPSRAVGRARPAPARFTIRRTRIKRERSQTVGNLFSPLKKTGRRPDFFERKPVFLPEGSAEKRPVRRWKGGARFSALFLSVRGLITFRRALFSALS